jgi:hypothetical protein
MGKMSTAGKEMTIKEIKEITEEFVENGIVEDGLVVYHFSFEIPKILRDLFEKNPYSISFNLNLPLDIGYKLAIFSVFYNKHKKYISKKSEVVDTAMNPHDNSCYIKHNNKKVLKISVYFNQTNSLLKFPELLEKYNYGGFFNFCYNVSLKNGLFLLYVEDFLIDFTYYGKVL